MATDLEIPTEPAELIKTAMQSLDAVTLQRDPPVILEEARKAAVCLMEVMRTKPNPVILGGHQFLENEDWLLIGHFYGVTAQIEADTYVTFGDVHGWEATAILVARDGRVLGRATAMCLDDEKNWRARPLFQLRSMAQTRASSRVHASVLRFVPVLAGFKSTPAEEMPDAERITITPAPLDLHHRDDKPVVIWPTVEDDVREVAPGLHVAPKSGSVYATPKPTGLHVLTNPRMEGGFHTWTVPNWDSEGGDLTVSTKLERVIQTAEIACAERRPVKLRVTLRKDRKAAAYLNGISDDDPTVPANEIF